MIYLSISDRIWVAIVQVPILTHPTTQGGRVEVFIFFIIRDHQGTILEISPSNTNTYQ